MLLQIFFTPYTIFSLMVSLSSVGRGRGSCGLLNPKGRKRGDARLHRVETRGLVTTAAAAFPSSFSLTSPLAPLSLARPAAGGAKSMDHPFRGNGRPFLPLHVAGALRARRCRPCPHTERACARARIGTALSSPLAGSAWNPRLPGLNSPFRRPPFCSTQSNEASRPVGSADAATLGIACFLAGAGDSRSRPWAKMKPLRRGNHSHSSLPGPLVCSVVAQLR